ncbi:alanine racemase [Agromyces silvae]|uniref:alanine racemase n=1 Tax=Agromyces silvae TaxID=3388266 RepID=UPI00280BFB12|nr:alanine racemase [Agromyces protaetiae]
MTTHSLTSHSPQHRLAEFVGAPLSQLPTPALLVERTVLERNITRMALVAERAEVALRPHWKTTKCLEVARMQRDAGAIGFTCATALEAETLVGAGHTDVFWAFPPIGRDRVETAVRLNEVARVIVGLDSFGAASELARVAHERGVVVPVRIEVDTGLGRTGTEPGAVADLAERIAGMPGIAVEGVFTHEGQLARLGAAPEERSTAGRRVGAVLVEAADAVRARGIAVASVSVGSTPGASSAPMVPGVNEMRPGTYVYGDDNQLWLQVIDEADCALSVLARVVSVERGQTLIVDAGLKAMSGDGSARGDGRFGSLPASPATLSAAHEEHGFLIDAGALQLGELVRIRPNHACGTVNMHSVVWVVEDERVVDAWPIVARR